MRPRLLDLCCRAGGAAMGYIRAGFDVVGWDIEDRSAVYPGKFNQGDVLDVLRDRHYLESFDVVHASFPCQSHTSLTKGTNSGREYADLIPEGRRLLDEAVVPYVLENVVGSPLRRDLTLCGEMFGLGVIRHRVFELSGIRSIYGHYVPQPEHVKHRGRVAGMRHGQWYEGPYFAVYGEGGGKGTVAQWQQAMGIDWTADRKDIAEAIPPAYTEYIGKQILRPLVRPLAELVVS